MKKRKGFTLIELMIVVAIIAILAAILIPNFLRARAQAQLSGCEGNLKNIATALEMYATDNGGAYPANITDNLFVGIYTRVIPTCPTGSVYTYNTASPYDNYSVFCTSTTSTHQQVLGLLQNRPQYDPISGLTVR